MRLWSQLKIFEYALLVVLVIVALAGLARWAVSAVAIVFVFSVVLRRQIRRQIRDWPPQVD